MNNQKDYALGGAKPISGMTQAGGTNAMQMVYSRRRGAASRDSDYRIQWTDNLLSNAWSMAEVFEAGAETINESFEIVTNRVPAEACRKNLFGGKLIGGIALSKKENHLSRKAVSLSGNPD